MERTSKTLLLAAWAVLFASAQAFAVLPTGTYGLGIIAGEPTGISGAYTLSPASTIDAALAYSYEREGSWQIHSDYLLTGNRIFNEQARAVDTYFGGGLRLKFENSMRFGFRVPVGVTYLFEKHPVQAFAEIAPILDLAPGTDLSINAAIGARYFF